MTDTNAAATSSPTPGVVVNRVTTGSSAQSVSSFASTSAICMSRASSVTSNGVTSAGLCAQRRAPRELDEGVRCRAGQPLAMRTAEPTNHGDILRSRLDEHNVHGEVQGDAEATIEAQRVLRSLEAGERAKTMV